VRCVVVGARGRGRCVVVGVRRGVRGGEAWAGVRVTTAVVMVLVTGVVMVLRLGSSVWALRGSGHVCERAWGRAWARGMGGCQRHHRRRRRRSQRDCSDGCQQHHRQHHCQRSCQQSLWKQACDAWSWAMRGRGHGW
jgi:hypothetical protein